MYSLIFNFIGYKIVKEIADTTQTNRRNGPSKLVKLVISYFGKKIASGSLFLVLSYSLIAEHKSVLQDNKRKLFLTITKMNGQCGDAQISCFICSHRSPYLYRVSDFVRHSFDTTQ
jgi:hypothetical protein